MVMELKARGLAGVSSAVQSAARRAIAGAVSAARAALIRDLRSRVPVRSGRLRRSLKSRVGGHVVRVVSGLRYARFVRWVPSEVPASVEAAIRRSIAK